MKTLTVTYKQANSEKITTITKEIEESQVEAYKHSYKKAIIAQYEKVLGYSTQFNNANLGSAEWRKIEEQNEVIDNLISTIKFELA